MNHVPLWRSKTHDLDIVGETDAINYLLSWIITRQLHCNAFVILAIDSQHFLNKCSLIYHPGCWMQNDSNPTLSLSHSLYIFSVKFFFLNVVGYLFDRQSTCWIFRGNTTSQCSARVLHWGYLYLNLPPSPPSLFSSVKGQVDYF